MPHFGGIDAEEPDGADVLTRADQEGVPVEHFEDTGALPGLRGKGRGKESRSEEEPEGPGVPEADSPSGPCDASQARHGVPTSGLRG